MFAASLAAGGPDWQRFRGHLCTPRTFLPPVAYANPGCCGGLPPGPVGGWVPTAPDPRSESAPEMTIRTDADIRKLREQGDLTRAEETLIENCRAGEPTRLGEDLPNGPSDARTVRDELLRYLICATCAEWSPTPSPPLRINAWGCPTFGDRY